MYKEVPRMWSPMGSPRVEHALASGSRMQAQHCHTTERHRRMALCENLVTPSLGMAWALHLECLFSWWC